MSLPTPKYAINDTVYAADVSWTAAPIQCPDCLGRKTWNATLPTGEAVVIACPTCAYGWDDSTGTIREHYAYTHRAQRLTIGSIAVDTNAEPDERVRYMCHETGIGSGSIWYEPRLYATETEALAALPGILAKRRDEHEQALAKTLARKRGKRGTALDLPGQMLAYYRREIRDAKAKIAAAEAGIARHAAAPAPLKES